MFVLSTLIGSLLLYRKSKYFPQETYFLSGPFRKHKNILNLTGYVLLLAAAIQSASTYGFGTGLVIFLTTLIFAFCLLLMVLPLHKNLAYLLAGVCIVLVVLENLL